MDWSWKARISFKSSITLRVGPIYVITLNRRNFQRGDSVAIESRGYRQRDNVVFPSCMWHSTIFWECGFRCGSACVEIDSTCFFQVWLPTLPLEDSRCLTHLCRPVRFHQSRWESDQKCCLGPRAAESVIIKCRMLVGWRPSMFLLKPGRCVWVSVRKHRFWVVARLRVKKTTAFVRI